MGLDWGQEGFTEEVKLELRSECGGGEITPCREDGMSEGHMTGDSRTPLRMR